MPVLSYKARAWLLSIATFLITAGYLPGVMSVSTTGRWAVITIVGLPTLLTWGLPRWNLGSMLVCVSFLWAWFGMFWSISPLDTFGAILHWMSLAGLGLLASRLEDRRYVWLALGLGVAISLPFTLLQDVGYDPVWTASRAGFPGNAGLFFTTNVLAEVSAVAFVLMFLQRQWLLAASAFLCAVLSGRSEVWLMLGTVGLLYWPLSRRYFLMVVIAAALAFVVLNAQGLAGPSMEHRIRIWTATIESITYFGLGLGSYAEAFYPVISFAHNELLQLIFELGIGSLLPISLVAYALVNGSNQNFPDKLALCALLASGTVWAPLQDPSTAFLVSILVGGLLGDRYRLDWLSAVQRGRYAPDSTRPSATTPGEVRKTSSGHSVLATGSQYSLGSGRVAKNVQPICR